MAVVSPVLLSGSTDGDPIIVVATATAGTLIHTAVSGTTSFDEVWLWASNVTASTATLTIEFGGVLDPGSHAIKALSIPANSPPIPIITGIRLNNGGVIRAFSGTASAINVIGNVNRWVP